MKLVWVHLSYFGTMTLPNFATAVKMIKSAYIFVFRYDLLTLCRISERLNGNYVRYALLTLCRISERLNGNHVRNEECSYFHRINHLT